MLVVKWIVLYECVAVHLLVVVTCSCVKLDEAVCGSSQCLIWSLKCLLSLFA